MKEYIYIIRGKIHIYPPCISHVVLLSKHVKKVTVICSECNDDTYEYLTNQGIHVIIIGDKRLTEGLLGKLNSYLYFRQKVFKILKNYSKAKNVLWFGTADSAFCMYGKLDGWKYLVNSLELYDKNSMYRKGLSLVLKNSEQLIVPEYNRASIMKYWFSLEKMPIVMPNKTLDHPKELKMQSANPEINDILLKIQGKKVIIFQGLIMWSLDHLKNLAKALSIYDQNYVLLLLGNKDEKITQELSSIYKDVLSIGYIPSPNHLVLTSHAYLGVATYDESSLNNLFCAPNKIYEYAGFGIPTLCSDLPGLKYSVGAAEAGIVTDLNKIEDIINALKLFERNYESFSLNAKRFFEGIENENTIKEIVGNHL